MTLSELFTVLDGVLPGKVAYYSWPVGEAPPLPFICYFSTGTENFGADNIVYHSGTNIRIELYTEQKDQATEASLQAALTSAGLFWTREDLFLNDERCFETIYEVTING